MTEATAPETPVAPAVDGATSESLIASGAAPVAGGDPAAPAAPPAAQPEAQPEPFDLAKVELPEGLTLDDGAKTMFTELATKHGITTDAAKDLLATYKTQVEAATNAAYDAYVKQNEAWVNEIKTDKVLGGPNLEGHLAKIGKLLDNAELVDPGFKDALNFTGAGNHPAVFRTMLKLAEKFTEGGHVAGTAPASPAPRPSPAKAMYPHLPEA